MDVKIESSVKIENNFRCDELKEKLMKLMRPHHREKFESRFEFLRVSIRPVKTLIFMWYYAIDSVVLVHKS